mmetsp:Transcript_4997/g.11064  ORF Transcript_4997/g.11064 Transcript_4997/m.11064 type:complete len:261 (+) Transcript_4997:1940-2722(+)
MTDPIIMLQYLRAHLISFNSPLDSLTPIPMHRNARHQSNTLLNQLIHTLPRQICQLPPLRRIPIKSHDISPILSKTSNRTRIRNGMIKHRTQSILDRTKTTSLLIGIVVILILWKPMRMRYEIRTPSLSYKYSMRFVQHLCGTLVELLCVQCHSRSCLNRIRNVHDDDVELLVCLHEVFVSVSHNVFHFGVVDDSLSAPFGEVLFAYVDYGRVDVNHDASFDGGMAEDFTSSGQLSASSDEDRFGCTSLSAFAGEDGRPE